jgi:hypothetical protein
MQYEKVIDMLGCKVKDKMTGITGTLTSVCFDLYGCIQCVINPGIVKDGKAVESHGWIDINRIEVKTKSKKIMEHPDFTVKYPSIKHVQGPADKPAAE